MPVDHTEKGFEQAIDHCLLIGVYRRSRQGPPFRAAPGAHPDVQSDRNRLLFRVFGIKAFVWIRLLVHVGEPYEKPGLNFVADGGRDCQRLSLVK
jgi:hypothetical protein